MHTCKYHIKEKLEKRSERGIPKVSNLGKRDAMPVVVK